LLKTEFNYIEEVWTSKNRQNDIFFVKGTCDIDVQLRVFISIMHMTALAA